MATGKGKQKEPTMREMADAIRSIAVAMQDMQAQFDSLQGDGFSGSGNGAGVEDTKQQYESSDGEKAKLRLTNLAFDTPAHKLPELTETPRLQVTPTCMVETINEFIKNAAEGKRVLLSDIFIVHRDKRMLSVGRKSRMEAMAFAQVEKDEEEGEKIEL